MTIRATINRIRAALREAIRPRRRDDDSIPALLPEGCIEVDEATRERFGDDLLRQLNGSGRDHRSR